MRPQYYYEPPRSNNWLDRLRPLTQPPTAYLIFFAGLILAIFLSVQSNPTISRIGPRLLILLIAFPIHELAHAVVADRLGDSTPRRSGRLTLNPLAQLNFLGSILMIVVGLGWAYVPINPSALRPNPRTGHMLVAAAGPIANLILAGVVALLWYALLPFIGGFPALENNAFNILSQFAFINIALFIFNLVPVPPLDGFAILKGLLPYSLAYQLERIQPYSFLIFMLLFFLAGRIMSRIIFEPAIAITRLLFSL
ncbi:MAG: site-2 protease family protein [Anaerolineae bacterium]|nr:site-2 protease family protein [Anaerolineae bacterium]